MNPNVLKWVTAAFKMAAIVEKVRGAKGGKEKLEAVIESTDDMLDAIETGLERDILVNEKVDAAKRNLISAYVSFQNAVRDAKAARVVTSEALPERL